MTLSTIIKKKKEEFDEDFAAADGYDFMDAVRVSSVKSFLEKAIRESVEEALREVRPKFNYEYDGRSCFFEDDFDSRVKEFMK